MPSRCECLFDPRCPTAFAAVQVLGSFGFGARPAAAWREAEGAPVLVVSDRPGNRLPLVAPLRRDGFRGPVVVLAVTDRVEILRRHGVLCIGSDSVFVWSSGRPAVELAAAAARLRGLSDDTFRLVQVELSIPVDFLTARVEPCLARLRERVEDAEALRELRELIGRAAVWSSRGWHAEAAIGGDRTSVGTHFRRLLDAIGAGGRDANRTADELAATFAAWHVVAANDSHQGYSDE